MSMPRNPDASEVAAAEPAIAARSVATCVDDVVRC
jgi:hypothetical protein